MPETGINFKNKITLVAISVALSGCASTTKLENYCLSRPHVEGEWTKLSIEPVNANSLFFDWYKGRPDPKKYSKIWYESDSNQILLCTARKRNIQSRILGCHANAVVFSKDSLDAKILAPDEIIVCTG